MDKTKTGIVGALGFAAGVTVLLLMGQAKPGNVIIGDRAEWTWTTAQASAALTALPALIDGQPVAQIRELQCRAVSTEEWQCSATFEREVKIEDYSTLKAARAVDGRAVQILDIAPPK